MLYDIQVRPNPKGPFFQYYTETVEAATSYDAIQRVQRANPGCQVTCTKSYNKPNNKSSGDSDVNVGGTGALIGLVVAAWAFVSFTPWILMGLGGAAGAWIGEKVTNQSVEEYADNGSDTDAGHIKAAITLALALILGGVGFVQGDSLKKGFDAPDAPAQVQPKN